MSERLGRIISNAFKVSVERRYSIDQHYLNDHAYYILSRFARMKGLPLTTSALSAALAPPPSPFTLASDRIFLYNYVTSRV